MATERDLDCLSNCEAVEQHAVLEGPGQAECGAEVGCEVGDLVSLKTHGTGFRG